MLFIFETCNALSQVTNVFAVKLYYLCRTGKPNQQLSYCLDENQPTHIIWLRVSHNFDSSNFCFYSHRNDREYAGNVFVDCLLGHQSWAVVSWSILFNLSDNAFMLQNLKCIMFQTVLSCWLNIIYLIQIILNLDVTFSNPHFECYCNLWYGITQNHVTPLMNYVCMDILKAIGDEIFHVSTMKRTIQNKYIVYSR